MKVNLILFSLFLLVSIMACNVFAFSISGGVSERSYKETEKTSAMTTTHSTKLQPSQAILFKMREDAPPLNLTEEMPPPFSDKGELSYSSCAIASVTWQVNNHV